MFPHTSARWFGKQIYFSSHAGSFIWLVWKFHMVTLSFNSCTLHASALIWQEWKCNVCELFPEKEAGLFYMHQSPWMQIIKLTNEYFTHMCFIFSMTLSASVKRYRSIVRRVRSIFCITFVFSQTDFLLFHGSCATLFNTVVNVYFIFAFMSMFNNIGYNNYPFTKWCWFNRKFYWCDSSLLRFGKWRINLIIFILPARTMIQ